MSGYDLTLECWNEYAHDSVDDDKYRYAKQYHKPKPQKKINLLVQNILSQYADFTSCRSLSIDTEKRCLAINNCWKEGTHRILFSFFISRIVIKNVRSVSRKMSRKKSIDTQKADNANDDIQHLAGDKRPKVFSGKFL